MMNYKHFVEKKQTVVVVGLGYVGLPLGHLLAQKYPVIGFDINKNRVKELQDGYDRTNEISNEMLAKSSLTFTSDPKCINTAAVIVVAVPTPITDDSDPDLKPLYGASATVGKYLAKGSLVIYESTVYPGLTEEECIPVLEKESGLVWGKDFFVGYSPERVNPGDKEHTIEKIVKVVGGDTPETTDFLTGFYSAVLEKPAHPVSSIMAAEASKIIENTQRDANIAIMNEFSMIFNKLGLDTKEVLDAASTKWNFLPFSPGLVGGHCIGVDPYYLIHRSLLADYTPDMIIEARKINSSMPQHVANNIMLELAKLGKQIKGSRVLLAGITFKEDVPDIRNTQVVNIKTALEKEGVLVDIHDPHADPTEVELHFKFSLTSELVVGAYDAVAITTAHSAYKDLLTADKIAMLSPGGLVADIRRLFKRSDIEEKKVRYWSL